MTEPLLQAGSRFGRVGTVWVAPEPAAGEISMTEPLLQAGTLRPL